MNNIDQTDSDSVNEKLSKPNSFQTAYRRVRLQYAGDKNKILAL